jgi:hypothetical protein
MHKCVKEGTARKASVDQKPSDKHGDREAKSHAPGCHPERQADNFHSCGDSDIMIVSFHSEAKSGKYR